MRTVVRAESWPIAGGFRIARGARATADVVVVELHTGGLMGRGECVPYPRYGESVESVREEIERRCHDLEASLTREWAHTKMPAGAARNAVDCALWDLEAKRAGRPVWELAGLERPPRPVRTMRTVSVDSPDAMGAAAEKLAHARALKVKLDGGPDLECIAAVHEAAPRSSLVIDANESWTAEQLRRWLPELANLGVVVLEQPLPATEDAILDEISSPVSLCADESFHDRRSFAEVGQRYDMVNIKLDKTGGLTEALHCVREAEVRGLRVMAGCMVCTSLAIEPALLLAPSAHYVDLDGPFLLAKDREGVSHDEQACELRPATSLWGGA